MDHSLALADLIEVKSRPERTPLLAAAGSNRRGVPQILCDPLALLVVKTTFVAAGEF